ncbi:MAG: Gfo/Idh/MocA family oxidoreductase [Litorilinea sp.]
MTIRIGILGTARIAPAAVIAPAQQLPQVEVVAIAARDAVRARWFARRYAIPIVHNTYADLIHDPQVDLVYNPLPNHLHGRWTLAALHAGKHVLCEKPLAANAAEAQAIVAAAQTANRLVMEAFHYRYHPVFLRVLELLAAGEIGPLQRLEAHFCVPLLRLGDIRYRYDLAGGATMDMGSYTVHMLRTLAGTEPQVIHARARRLWTGLGEQVRGIDRRMEADLLFPRGGAHHTATTGATRETSIAAHMSVSMLSSTPFRVLLLAQGATGELRLLNPILPHRFHRLRVRTGTTWRTEKYPGAQFTGDTTYTWQMRALVHALETGTPPPTDARDGLANMRVIDAIYRQAGLPLRMPAPTGTPESHLPQTHAGQGTRP